MHALWYASKIGSIPDFSCLWPSKFRTSFPFIAILFYGFVTGFFSKMFDPKILLLLALVLAIISGVQHWTIGQLGMRIDMGTAGFSILTSIFILIINIPLCVIGGFIGGLVASVTKKNQV